MLSIIHQFINIIILFTLQPVNRFEFLFFPGTKDFFCTH